MSLTFEDLRILNSAEEIADSIWKVVVQWDEFAQDIVGKQVARSADSVGANIADSFGRFNFGEKLQFLYYSRGSIVETKYWLNRTRLRGLMQSDEVQEYVTRITDLARQLHTFARSLKTIREAHSDYWTANVDEFTQPPFTEDDLNWLSN